MRRDSTNVLLQLPAFGERFSVLDSSLRCTISRVKKRTILFPRIEDCGSFLDEFACEVAKYDDLNRSIKYSHPETQPDDCLHATNYALLVGIRAHTGRMIYGVMEE